MQYLLGFKVCIIRGAPAMSFHTWRWRELERMICWEKGSRSVDVGNSVVTGTLGTYLLPPR